MRVSILSLLVVASLAAGAASAAQFTEGQEVEALRFSEWVPARFSRQTETQICVMLPLADGRYDPAVSVVICMSPEQVRPAGKAQAPGPAPDGRIPGTGPVTPDRPLTPGQKVWHHTGAFDPSTLVGTWLTQGHVVKVVHEEKQIDADTIEQKYSMGGGHVGGHVQIRPDGTFVRVAPSGKKFTGKWTVESSQYFKGVVLWGGDEPTGWGKDLVVTPLPDDQVTIQSYPSGGAGYRGWRAKDTAGLDLDDATGAGFFQRSWRLTRTRFAAGLKTDFGRLTIRPDGTWEQVDGAQRSAGKWTADKTIDGIRLAGFMDQGGFMFLRENDQGYVRGGEPGVNSHLAYRAAPQ